MAYDVVKRNFDKEKFALVEIDVEYCGNTFGVAPCTATGSGDSKCYNCRSTCQDLPNFTATTKTVRHCTNRSPHPANVNAIPDLLDVNLSPSKIDLKGGLGVRASITLSFADHPHSDRDLDLYVDERTFDPFERSLYWLKFRSRWPNYQNNEIRVYAGYLDQGAFDISNFEARYYIIDKLDVSDGKATLTGKDPLKLASQDKAQAPVASTGKLTGDLLIGETSATLIPPGVGNEEYPTSGKVLIRNEVMTFTRSGDSLTFTRAQNNTVEEDHTANDTVQLCLEYVSEQVHDIAYDLITNYANIDTNYIDLSAWQTEIDTFISGLLSGIIVKPVDVNNLLKELAQAMPHYLWWDERENKIQLTALKPPQTGSQLLNMDANILKDSFKTTDKKELRKSTIVVNYGQFNPVKNLDEPDNYQATYIRDDKDSVTAYGSREYLTINSRWITNLNESAARQLAALIGRRFADIPREINFDLEAKDSNVWLGQNVSVNHRDVVDASGSPVDTDYQITSASEKKNFSYTALEFTYGDSLPEDEGGGEPGVTVEFIPNESTNLNLRTFFDSLNPEPDENTVAKFILDRGRVCGSTSNTAFALDTGTWPPGAQVILQINPSAVGAGKGGEGEEADGTPDATNGGPFLLLNHDLELINNGVIGGGGGGGARSSVSQGRTAGGGGAGFNIGIGGGVNIPPVGVLPTTNIVAQDGAVLTGGAGGYMEWFDSGEPFISEGGNGGGLGEDGGTGLGGDIGLAGIAIDKNGFTLTETVTGDIRGNIIA